MSDKSENILIGYTKWLLKWFAIVSIVIGVGFGGLFGYDEYQKQIVPMIAIECETPRMGQRFPPLKGQDTTKTGGIVGKRHYLVQKKRRESLPHALYRPSYYNKTITQDTSPDDYWYENPFDREDMLEDHPTYVFQRSGEQIHFIARDTLHVVVFIKETDKQAGWAKEKMDKCRQITFDEFSAESERGLNLAKSKLKF